jgi:hypothetical protein
MIFFIARRSVGRHTIEVTNPLAAGFNPAVEILPDKQLKMVTKWNEPNPSRVFIGV